jgi:hypothetical protein
MDPRERCCNNLCSGLLDILSLIVWEDTSTKRGTTQMICKTRWTLSKDGSEQTLFADTIRESPGIEIVSTDAHLVS